MVAGKLKFLVIAIKFLSNDDDSHKFVYQKALIPRFTAFFLLPNNLCEFLTRKHKFKGLFCSRKLFFTPVWKISDKQIHLQINFVLFYCLSDHKYTSFNNPYIFFFPLSYSSWLLCDRVGLIKIDNDYCKKVPSKTAPLKLESGKLSAIYNT